MELTVWIWAGLAVIFLIVEAACPLHLVSIWFAIGSLVAGIVALLHGGIGLQIALFLVVSCGLLISMLPLVKKFIKPNIVKTNVEGVIGTEGYVTEAIDNIAATGQVKLGGMYWTARSENGKNIEAGKLVKVERIEGVKVFVSPVNAEVTEEIIG